MSCRRATLTVPCAAPAWRWLTGRGHPTRRSAAGLLRHLGHAGHVTGVVVILCDGWDRGNPEVLAEQMARLSRVACQGDLCQPVEGITRLRATGPGHGRRPALRRRVRRGPQPARIGGVGRSDIAMIDIGARPSAVEFHRRHLGTAFCASTDSQGIGVLTRDGSIVILVLHGGSPRRPGYRIRRRRPHDRLGDGQRHHPHG